MVQSHDPSSDDYEPAPLELSAIDRPFGNHITVVNNPAVTAKLEQLRLDVQADLRALYWGVYILFACCAVLGVGLLAVA